MYDVTFFALTRAYADLKRDEFDDLSIGVDDLNEALPIIIKQCGFKEQPPEPGKALAQTPSTGTE
jgi:hypothetical protein